MRGPSALQRLPLASVPIGPFDLGQLWIGPGGLRLGLGHNNLVQYQLIITNDVLKSCHEKLSKVKKQKEKNSKIRKRNFLNRTDNMTKKKIQKNDLIERTLAENL